MTHRGIGAMALVGAAAGAVMSAVLISSPMAYADWPPVPSITDFTPPGTESTQTIIDNSSFPDLYSSVDEIDHYLVYDSARDLVGSYDVKDTGLVLGSIPYLSQGSEVVIDSTGAAPAVGTVWDLGGSGIVLGSLPFNFEFNDYTNSPGGTTVDEFEILLLGLGNFYSSGPAGTFDELALFGTVVPIIDAPASTAMSAGLDMGDLGGLTDLGAL